MENKIIFREILTEIKKAADEAGNRISHDKIKEMLADIPLEEEHFQMIYEYLSQQNIRVADSEEEAQELPDEDARRSLSIYLEELEQLEKESFEEEHMMLERAIAGDPEAKRHLIEGYLPLICEMASEYEGTELPAEDLIQEGNLGLLMAMETIDAFSNAAACRAHILNGINKAMEDAISGTQDLKRNNDGIVSRVNHLNEAVQNLERDLEHKVSAQELSAYLDMPMEEIEDLLRMSGDQIELEGK